MKDKLKLAKQIYEVGIKAYCKHDEVTRRDNWTWDTLSPGHQAAWLDIANWVNRKSRRGMT